MASFRLVGFFPRLVEKPVGDLVSEQFAELLDATAQVVDRGLTIGRFDRFGQTCNQHSTGIDSLRLEAIQTIHDGFYIVDRTTGSRSDLPLQAVKLRPVRRTASRSKLSINCAARELSRVSTANAASDFAFNAVVRLRLPHVR